MSPSQRRNPSQQASQHCTQGPHASPNTSSGSHHVHGRPKRTLSHGGLNSYRPNLKIQLPIETYDVVIK